MNRNNIRRADFWRLLSRISIPALPVLLVSLITFNVWVTKELLACKYTMLSVDDGIILQKESADYVESRFNPIILKLNNLQESVNNQSNTIAQLVIEIRVLRERLDRQDH